ncbi:DUF5050 domain-containing protein [Eubacterium limosum]|uniref:DUF5050 domain-containing protein n=1 Tax=Eubacterium limosum TaxID=1736 RepID=UPI0022DEF4A9|nr:DUF5050 domain-containing protein [Eubacterium limosum]
MEKAKYIFRKKGWLGLLLIAVIGVGFFSYIAFKNANYTKHLSNGNLLLEKGQFDDAIAELGKASQIKIKQREPYLLLARTYFAKESYDLAKENVEKASALGKTGEEAFILADIQTAAGETEAAAKAVEEGKELLLEQIAKSKSAESKEKYYDLLLDKSLDTHDSEQFTALCEQAYTDTKNEKYAQLKENYGMQCDQRVTQFKDFGVFDGNLLYTGMGRGCTTYTMDEKQQDVLIGKEEDVRTLNIKGDWIYYAASEGDLPLPDYSIRKIKKDGTEETILRTFQDHEMCSGITVVGNYIYFYAGSYAHSGFYRMRLSGDHFERLSLEKENLLAIMNGEWVYGGGLGVLFRTSLKDMKTETLFEIKSIENDFKGYRSILNFREKQLYGDNIYFQVYDTAGAYSDSGNFNGDVVQYKLYQLNLKNKAVKEIKVKNICDFLIQDDKIYYICKNTGILEAPLMSPENTQLLIPDERVDEGSTMQMTPDQKIYYSVPVDDGSRIYVVNMDGTEGHFYGEK